MTVLMTMDLPVKRADLEAVSAAMGVHDNPPAGLVVHVMSETANGVHIVDIWESQDAFDKFNNGQLMPTMQKVMAERNISMDGPPPEPTFDEAFDMVRGR
jgi:hypothetical protein